MNYHPPLYFPYINEIPYRRDPLEDMSAVALLFAGAVSDARGRKGIMAASTLCSALLTLLTAVAPGWIALLTLRALLGLTLAGLPAIAMTYLSEEVHAESIGLGMGLYIGGSAVGGLGGRLLTGIVADFFGWRWAMAAMGAVGLVCALVFSRSLPPSRRFVPQPLELDVLMRRFAGTFADPGLPWLFAEGFVLLGAFVTLYNYIGYRLMAPPYALSQAAVGLLFSVYLVGTFSSTFIGISPADAGGARCCGPCSSSCSQAWRSPWPVRWL